MFGWKFQSEASMLHCLGWKNKPLLGFVSESVLTPESTTFFFFNYIQIKPFTEAEETPTTLILTDLCGMNVWD